MIGLIIIAIVVMLLFNSFSKFNAWTRQHEANLREANEMLRIDFENIELRYTKAVSLMQLKNYPEAIREFQFVSQFSNNALYNPLIQSSRKNVEFCKKPLPWSPSYSVNKSGNYMHHIMLNYFGGTRNIMDKKYL